MASNQFFLGMDQDVHPKYIKDGKYRYALNAILETELGEQPSISNEIGNSICASLPAGLKINGHALTDNHEIVLFLYDPAPSRPNHQIGIYDPINCSYTPIVIDQLLNFSDQHPVTAFVRIKNGCNRFVYFADNYNNFRVANLTDTSEWVNEFQALTDHTKIEFTRPYSYPQTQAANSDNNYVLPGGGELEYGSYSFYIRYLDVDLNPTIEWLPLTNYISVGYGTQSNQNTSLLHGADNEVSSPLYKPRANKHIKFRVTMLDTKFKYFQVAVLKRTALGGAISGIDVLRPRPITNPVLPFEYTGFQNEIEYATSIDDLLTPLERIEKVVDHILDDNRLYIAGHTRTKYDYSGYQRAASKIKVTYLAEAVTERTSSDPENHVYPITMNPEEIEALGIVWLHADGSQSPVFHIPGRPVNSVPADAGHYHYKIGTYTNWDTDDLTGDVDVFDATKTKRWQVYSTASIDMTLATDDAFSGFLGYYECDTTYPEIEICDGHEDGYWGRDWEDNLIVPGVTKIRHHRMPPQYNHPQGDNESNRPQYAYKLKLDNIDYPDDSVVGYYIVTGDKSNQGTVLDRGYLVPLSWDPVDEVFYYSYNNWRTHVHTVLPDDIDLMKHYAFISPKTMYSQVATEGSYITLEKFLVEQESDEADTDGPATTIEIPEFSASYDFHSRIYNYNRFKAPDNRLNYPITASNFIAKREPAEGEDTDPTTQNSSFILSTGVSRIENRSVNLNVLCLELPDYLEEFDAYPSPVPVGTETTFKFNHMLAVIKSNRDVFNNLFAINYNKLSSAIFIFGSPVFLSGGDHFIPYVDTLDIFWNSGNTWAQHATTPIVHPINSQLRYSSDIDRGRFSNYKHDDAYNHESLKKYLVSKYYELEVNQPRYFPEYYEINHCYNFLLPDKQYYPIPFNYDFCADCIERNPFRVYYSEQDFSEDRTDKLRIVRANNYKDVDGNSGPITGLAKAFEQVVLFTSQGSYFIYNRPQTLSSDNSSIYIGTGEVLSLPFRKLTATDFALGGINHFMYGTNTEFGYAFIDELSGRPLLITGNLNDISKSMRSFWENNGKLLLKEQIKKITNHTYTNLVTTASHGIGYTLAYDPRYKRLIVAKKDYVIRPQYASTFTVGEADTSPDRLWLNTLDNKFYLNDSNGDPSEAQFSNQFIFENRSFTASYSFISNEWVSFHSYFPYYLYNDYDTFYSNGTWKHNYGRYQHYYDKHDPHVVDLIAVTNPLEIKYASNIFYSSNVTEYDALNRQYTNVWDKTYDGVIFYNSKQISGYQALLSKKHDPFSIDFTGIVYTKETDNQHRVSDIRDLAINPNIALWSSDWNNLIPTPYLDKVPNPLNVNYSKSFYEQARFRDHYLGMRLFFNPGQNWKITTDLISTVTANRNR